MTKTNIDGSMEEVHTCTVENPHIEDRHSRLYFSFEPTSTVAYWVMRKGTVYRRCFDGDLIKSTFSPFTVQQKLDSGIWGATRPASMFED